MRKAGLAVAASGLLVCTTGVDAGELPAAGEGFSDWYASDWYADPHAAAPQSFSGYHSEELRGLGYTGVMPLNSDGSRFVAFDREGSEVVITFRPDDGGVESVSNVYGMDN